MRQKKRIDVADPGATAYGEEQRRRDEAVDAFIENERALGTISG